MNPAAASVAGSRSPVLRRKYFWFLGSFVTLLLLLTSAPDAYFAFRENKANIAQLQSVEARLAASRVSNFLEFQERLLAEVDRLPWASGVLTDEDRVSEYERLMKLVPAIMEIEHVDAAEAGQFACRALLPTMSRSNRVLPANLPFARRRRPASGIRQPTCARETYPIRRWRWPSRQGPAE